MGRGMSKSTLARSGDCANILLCSLQGSTHITNQTDSYTCQINPIQVPYEQHAQGDCSIPDGKGPFEVSVLLS